MPIEEYVSLFVKLVIAFLVPVGWTAIAYPLMKKFGSSRHGLFALTIALSVIVLGLFIIREKVTGVIATTDEAFTYITGIFLGIAASAFLIYSKPEWLNAITGISGKGPAKKILIIDDEKDFCFFVKENLEVGGHFKVIVAANGPDGLSAAIRARPHLILLDILMPDMSGFEVLKDLKKRTETASVPVVMLTAVGTDEAKARALGLYNEDYIVKPVNAADLKSKINEVLARSLNVRF
ncbi:MAG: response regulator [Candidatus Omnitrophica bacterium]|nr:response regulator [Candidatus Omnitrophota bacterium]